MDIEKVNGDIILHGVECLDLDLTLDCGQAFRWVKQDDGSYSSVVKNVFLNIAKIDKNTFILKDTSEENFINIFLFTFLKLFDYLYNQK